jgi:N-acetyl sugar amidotransferase
MQVCRRCLYPAHHPLGIDFDAEGICTGCRIHEEKDRLDWSLRERQLASLLDGYRGRTRGRHDCVVPISGGRDSFFIVHLVRKVYGLNPLLVVYNRHYNSRAGIYNIERLRTAFGCDINTLTLAPELVRRIMRATLALRGSFHWQALAGQTVFPVQTAVRMNIPLVIWGAHQGLEQVGMFSHLDEVEMTRRYRREHDLMDLEAEDLVGQEGLREGDLHPFFYPEDVDLRRTGVRGIYLGNYHRWDTKAQHERMVDLYDYYVGPLPRTFDHYNDVDDLHYAGFHDLLKVRKHGYGKALDHACREIRFGRMTRQDGTRLVAEYETRPAPDGAMLADFIRVSEPKMFELADRHRNPKRRDRGVNGGGGRRDIGAAPTDQPPTCAFRTHIPVDMSGPADGQQLLTRGYARE